eukprot:1142087-Pelagomonas_calceolata.AAC.3
MLAVILKSQCCAIVEVLVVVVVVVVVVFNLLAEWMAGKLEILVQYCIQNKAALRMPQMVHLGGTTCIDAFWYPPQS